MSDELKPVHCGCGGNWAIVMGRHPVAKYIYWYVRCEDCGTRTDEYDTKEQAIEAWNKAMGAYMNSVVSVFSSEVKDE